MARAESRLEIAPSPKPSIVIGMSHEDHQVAGRHRTGPQIEKAVRRLRRGDALVLPCAVDEDCYGQVWCNPQGVYIVEHRAGSPAEHYQTRTLSADVAASHLIAWTRSEPGWMSDEEWENIGSMFADDLDAAVADGGDAVGVKGAEDDVARVAAARVDVAALLATATVAGTLADGTEVKSVRVEPGSALAVWAALRDAHGETGLWPFL